MNHNTQLLPIDAEGIPQSDSDVHHGLRIGNRRRYVD